jgi:hypothetical protein
MLSSVSSTPTSSNVQQYPAAHSAPPPKAVNASADSVQLSAQSQFATTPPKQSVPAPSLDQLVKAAANGDFSALARLTMIG